MKFSQVCIDRPVLATVMSLLIFLFGLICLGRLPNRSMPDVDPPIVSITTVFPGAAPEVVETSVTQQIEDQVIGIEGVKHVTSTSREQVSSISIEFELGRDMEAAANDVRDRVARARSQLPDEVEDPVVAKRESDANAIIWLALSGEHYDQVRLTSIAERYIVDRIGKLPGVSTVLVGGERRYSMRVWIDNERLTSHQLTISDVVAALGRENVDLPSGRVESSSVEFTVRSLGELQTAESYSRLIVANVSGNPIRLEDIADVEVGAEDDRKIVRYNGVPGLGLGIVKQSKANTLSVADAVKAEMERLRGDLPAGVKLEIAFDSSVFIRDSLSDVTRTIFEAALLVVIVIYGFLRSARATIIPAVTIPVSIVGAFAALYIFDFSINTLTLMGVTLAIGLVVDDAIVVLENITRWIEDGHSPLEASRRGMQEISFAVVSATVSAVAVFLPLTFLTDTTGRLFREFAVTVATAVGISGFVALTLSPALCAIVLRRSREETGLKAVLGRSFDRLSEGYGRRLRGAIARPRLWVVLGLVWTVMGGFLFINIDQELVPRADRGVVIGWTRAPEGSTIEYTDRYQRQAEQVFLSTPEVARVFSVVALGIGTPGLVNQGALFTMLHPKADRERADISDTVGHLMGGLKGIAGIQAWAVLPSPLRGFTASPVSLVIQGDDVHELARHAEEIKRRLEEMGGFANVDTDLFLNKPQLEIEIDRDRASDLGVSVRDIATTLQILLGGVDISTFKLSGETYDVIAQLRRESRSNPQDLLGLYVNGENQQLVPLYSVVDARETIAPRDLPHFDRLRSVTLTSDLSDLSQGEALERVEEVAAAVLPRDEGYRMAFSGESERFFESGNALLFAYALAVLIVYLVLAAQFESFVHPITILVAVALSFTGALLTLYVCGAMGVSGTSLNLFSKIGLVMLVGLVTKNSILIVEFANQLRERGLGVAEATLEASRSRFRPILMTALATIAGITPIALGLGAGGESRRGLGVAVVGGMFFSTLFTFFIVPATYVAVEKFRERIAPEALDAAPESTPAVNA